MKRQTGPTKMERLASEAREYVERSAKYCHLIDVPTPFDIEAVMDSIGRAKTSGEIEKATASARRAMEYVILRFLD